MTDDIHAALPTDPLPKAINRTRRRSFSGIWILPAVAALVSIYLIGARVGDLGPVITLEFNDVSGLRTGYTPILHRGVKIGEVVAVELNPERDSARVSVRLKRSAGSVAKEGSLFWIVRPEVSLGTITGLGNVFSGPIIEVLPGTGAVRTSFKGLPGSPAVLDREGLGITLITSRAGSLRPNMPVCYRGVEVGAVLDCQLSTNATTAEVHVLIRKRFAGLVREGSKFWNASGADVNLALFGGLDIAFESMGAMLSGGISFATPGDSELSSVPAGVGAVFILHDKAEDEWLGWAPAIGIARE